MEGRKKSLSLSLSLCDVWGVMAGRERLRKGERDGREVIRGGKADEGAISERTNAYQTRLVKQFHLLPRHG